MPIAMLLHADNAGIIKIEMLIRLDTLHFKIHAVKKILLRLIFKMGLIFKKKKMYNTDSLR